MRQITHYVVYHFAAVMQQLWSVTASCMCTEPNSLVVYTGGLGIFLFTTAFRTVLGPTQLLIQWVSGALSPGIKRPVREANHSLPSIAEVKE
jgi:hypothetical protein